jgi:hypothetical protein
MTVSYMDDYKKNIAIKRREEDDDDNDNDKRRGRQRLRPQQRRKKKKKKKKMAAGRRPPTSMKQAESGLCMCGQPSLTGEKTNREPPPRCSVE